MGKSCWLGPCLSSATERLSEPLRQNSSLSSLELVTVLVQSWSSMGEKLFVAAVCAVYLFWGPWTPRLSL